MSEEYNYIDAMITHREAQRKYDFFFLGVTAAALSLSIQTFSAYETNHHPVFGIISWILLLISFLSGMFRQERILQFLYIETDFLKYKGQAGIIERAKMANDEIYKNYKELWSVDDIDKELEKLKGIVASADTHKKRTLGRVNIAYKIQKWSFVLGLIVYLVFAIINI